LITLHKIPKANLETNRGVALDGLGVVANMLGFKGMLLKVPTLAALVEKLHSFLPEAS